MVAPHTTYCDAMKIVWLMISLRVHCCGGCCDVELVYDEIKIDTIIKPCDRFVYK